MLTEMLHLAFLPTFILYMTSYTQAQSTHFVSSLRLVNDVTNQPSRGRVVIQMNYVTVDGSICVVGWDDNDARVVCRMLGLTGGKAVTTGIYGTGNHNFRMSGVQCSGSEATLTVCPRASSIACEYSDNEAGVECDTGTPVVYQASELLIGESIGSVKLDKPATKLDYGDLTVNGNVRLRTVEGVTGMGYVQVKNPATGTWGYICDDEWSELDATVVCRELNYTDCCARPGVLEIYTTKITVVEPILLDDVKCQGTEASIVNCSHSSWGSNNCKGVTLAGDNALTTEYAGVQCLPQQEQSPFQNLPDPQVSCTPTSIVVNFLYITSSVQFLPVRGLSGCNAASVNYNSTNVVVTIPLYQCGTTLTTNGTHNIYQNHLTYEKISPMDSLLVDSQRFRYTVQCAAPIQIRTDFIRDQPVVSEESKIFSIAYKYEVAISFFQDSNCSLPISERPYVVNISSWVYVGVKLVTNDPTLTGSALRLVLTNCQATPTESTLGVSSYLINNKCPLVDTVSVYPINNTVESFGFKAFQFQGYAQVYIRCDVIICLSNDTSAACDRSCGNNKPVAGRRKRDADTLSRTVVSPAIRVYNSTELTLTIDLTLLNSPNVAALPQATALVLWPTLVMSIYLYTRM